MSITQFACAARRPFVKQSVRRIYVFLRSRRKASLGWSMVAMAIAAPSQLASGQMHPCASGTQNGFGYRDGPADYNGDGVVDWRDPELWFYESQSCTPSADLSDVVTPSGRQTAEDDIRAMIQLWMDLHSGQGTAGGVTFPDPPEDVPCVHGRGAFATIMQSELGELPGDLDIDPEVDTPCDDVIDPDTDGPSPAEEAPMGPIWCSSASVCDNIGDSPGVGPGGTTNQGPGPDLCVCAGISCGECPMQDLNNPPVDIEIEDINEDKDTKLPEGPEIPEGPGMFPLTPPNPGDEDNGPPGGSPPEDEDRGGGNDDEDPGEGGGDDEDDTNPWSRAAQHLFSGFLASSDDDQTGDGCDENGDANPVAERPVSLPYGHKIERQIDLRVRVTGPDFRLKRIYTSQPDYEGPAVLGNHWHTPAYRYLSFDPTQGTNGTVTLSGQRMTQVLAMTDSDGDDEYMASGAAHSYAKKATLTMGTDTWPVWRLVHPGGRVIDFYRPKDSKLDPPATLEPESEFYGQILQIRDQYGHTRTYEHRIYRNSATQVGGSRLRAIYINGSPQAGTEPEAEIHFRWYLSPGDTSHALNGKLARVQVIRPHDSGGTLETQRVEYTYKHGGDPFSDDVGTNGDLIQVTKYIRQDSWENTKSDISPNFPHRVSVTQYRYHDGASVSTGDERLDVEGKLHQLKSVLRPEQIDYYAQKLHNNGGASSPSYAARDAAYRLMLRDDDAVAFRD